MNDKLLIICGPTATGKTKLAVSLAQKFDGELISADSRQVYRGMDLVTGKEWADVPIWLYDVVDPDHEFSVSHWAKLAKDAIADIQNRGKLPVVVGGTGLYIKALLDPFETIDIPPNKKLRESLGKLTVGQLQKMVSRGAMNESDWNNPRRLIRRIEISKSKRTMIGPQKIYDVLICGLTAPIGVLDTRIDERLKKRLEEGMKKEMDTLVKKYDRSLPAMSAIGVNEHAYSRRQMTWFRKMPGIQWFDITDPQLMAKVTTKVTAWYTQKEVS